MLDANEILAWLRTDDPAALEELWRRADAVRRTAVGDAVHLRGLIEVSNHCVRRCAYCGLHVGNAALTRYRMTDAEVMACAADAVRFGYGTVVIQAGEDPGLGAGRVADWVARIKRETPLAVTLSLGERGDDELRAWRAAGANRYLLRFETSDPELYRRIHPNRAGEVSDRIALLRRLRAMGYEIGSGVMIGIPGQSYATLARDILRFAELDLDMVGVGPFLPHPGTPLGQGMMPDAASDQVPATEGMVYKVVALTRLACPEANIPSTTALATINKASGRELGLMRGANVVMPNLTPTRYRALYEIYPDKACINETAQACRICLGGRIASIGRTVGQGPGGRRPASARSGTSRAPE
jgi:biotin synthase